LEDLYKGKLSKLQLGKNVICQTCNGLGGKEGATQPCAPCKGRGAKIIVRQIGPGMIQQMQSVCPDCKGERTVIAEKDRCKACLGKKTTKETKLLEVPIDAGMREGQKIHFRGEGDQEPNIEPGDVIIVIQQKEHERFIRDNDNLFIKHTINLTEALCGFQLVIQHLDGRNIVMKTSPGDVIEPGSVRGIVGEGMPRYKHPELRGNLYVKFDIEFPQNHFSGEAQLQKLASLLPPRPKVELPKGDMVEEVNLMPFEDHLGGEQFGGRREAYDDESEDEEGGGMPGAQRVQCAHQ
jgi:DnaJ family protein A protein 2